MRVLLRFSRNNGSRAFILQLVNSKGDIRNCRVALLNGLALNQIIYCGDSLYDEIKSNGNFGSIEILPSSDHRFVIQLSTNSTLQNGIFQIILRISRRSKCKFLRISLITLVVFPFLLCFCIYFSIEEKRELRSPDKLSVSGEKFDRFYNHVNGKPQNVHNDDCTNGDPSDDDSCDTCSTGDRHECTTRRFKS